RPTFPGGSGAGAADDDAEMGVADDDGDDAEMEEGDASDEDYAASD
ncbi:hypothetical protein A2U01_0044291, partial [Trifolium medium]|nr:hypothetical protein [Trifolium medium]